ncbi:hypothetical protein V6N11_008721 [Hibiscus sabdariffa]|uniref:Uncharacterized protein n=2 Tax=Hibiscus sabdariffa TaxID=183260 RepID=A0ABR2BPG4_9ROSI
MFGREEVLFLCNCWPQDNSVKAASARFQTSKGESEIPSKTSLFLDFHIAHNRKAIREHPSSKEPNNLKPLIFSHHLAKPGNPIKDGE